MPLFNIESDAGPSDASTVLDRQSSSREISLPKEDVPTEFIPFSPPSIGDDEVDAVVQTLRSGWLTTGPRTKQFEEEFTSLIGCEAALALSSATAALQIALAVEDVRPGDEVITTTLTFCSTAHVIEHLGARPVLVDVEPDTLCIDPHAIEIAITKRTKAVMPVHLYGHPADLDAIKALASAHHFSVIEDAAHSLPACYRGKRVGSGPNATAFSFYATKNMTTGEGGMLTGSKELINRARPWSLHGISRDAYNRYNAEGSWFYEVVNPGYKCNMMDIQAALGLAQLKRLNSFQARRRHIVDAYNSAFQDNQHIEIPVERQGAESAWHIYSIRLNLETLTIDRSQFMSELKRRNVGASVHFIPLHVQPYYRDKYGYLPSHFPVAWSNYLRQVSLPLNPNMTDEQVSRVAEAVNEITRLTSR